MTLICPVLTFEVYKNIAFQNIDIYKVKYRTNQCHSELLPFLHIFYLLLCPRHVTGCLNFRGICPGHVTGCLNFHGIVNFLI